MDREANGWVEGSKKRVTGPWSASNVPHTHVRSRIHKSIIARGCRRSAKEEGKLPRSVPVPHWTRASPAEFFRISLPVPLSEPPTMARSAIREGFPLPYLIPYITASFVKRLRRDSTYLASSRSSFCFSIRPISLACSRARCRDNRVCADAQFNALSINRRPSLVHVTLQS